MVPFCACQHSYDYVHNSYDLKLVSDLVDITHNLSDVQMEALLHMVWDANSNLIGRIHLYVCEFITYLLCSDSSYR